MPLKNLPIAARPREKILERGPAALADAELLAILLRTGTAGRGVLQMAEELLDRFGGMSGLLHARPDELRRFKGLGGPAKRAELLVVLELARRALAQQLREREVLDSPKALCQYLQLYLAAHAYESFAVLFLDNGNRLIALEELFRGSLHEASVYPREVALRTLYHNASAVVLAHNHPSGNVQPSNTDVTLTRTLQAALALIDVYVLDHIIVAQGKAFSMRDAGWIQV